MTAFLDRAGAGGYKLKLNNLGTLEEREVFRGILKEYFQPFQGKLCEDCKNRLNKNVFRLLDCKNESCRAIVKGSPPITGYLTAESKAHFDNVCALLGKAGIAFTLDPYMVRGLDYYTKTVFEVTHPKLGAQDALGAGGRYDRLIESFGGTRAGAVGFAVGVERLVMCLAGEKKEAEPHRSAFFVATMGEAAQVEGFKLLAGLRNAGLEASMDVTAKSLKSQMRQADKLRCRFVIILGDNELKDGKFQLKNMADSSQEMIDLAGAVEILKKKKES